MSLFKKGRGGTLYLEQTPEEKLAAIERARARQKEKDDAAAAKAEAKKKADDEYERIRLLAKEKEKNILTKISTATGSTGSTGSTTTTTTTTTTPAPQPAPKKKEKAARTQTTDTVECVTWPFKDEINDKVKATDGIFRFPGQMIIPKIFVANQEKFRRFFSPSDQVVGKGAVFQGFTDPTKIVLFKETSTHYVVPDFFESFGKDTDLTYDQQQTDLKKLFKHEKIPPIIKFAKYFREHRPVRDVKSVIVDTGDKDEDGNIVYSHGDLTLKSEQVATLRLVHEHFSNTSNRRILLKLGTGVGKTFTALLIAKMLKPRGKIGIIVNTSNQIAYWYSEIEKIFPTREVLDYTASPKEFREKFDNAKFFIFSQQSAAYTTEKIMSMYKCTEEVEDWYDQFDVVLVDECHEMCSNTRRPFAANFCNAYVIGLSATPDLKETVRRITFLYYGNIISINKLLLYASKNNIILKPTVYEYDTIYKVVNYLAYPVYTEVDDCVKGRISMRKEEVPLPQCLTAKGNADIHRIYMLAHIALETALEGRCTILLCKTVDYLYMIRDVIQRLMNGEKPIMLHDPSTVLKCKTFNPAYPEYLSKAVLPDGEGEEVDAITLRYRSGIGEKAVTITLGGEESKARYGHLAKNPMYNNPIIINSKYKGDWDEDSVTEAIANTNIILSTVQSLGTGYNIKKANTIIMAHSVIMAYEQCVGRIKRDTVGMDRHGYDVVDSGCGVFKAQYNKRCKKFYNNHDDKREMHFYEADDIILKKKEDVVVERPRRVRLEAGDAPVTRAATATPATPEATTATPEAAPTTPKVPNRVKLPQHLMNYKATIDVVPQALKMERLKRVTAAIDEDEELDAWGE